ncbi:hypothetical protein HYW42_01105 [Candidatus Daviesbacteria bacterium]|nr:hypothetical protein [Candidatus Daviesbacteria bacterium]
MTLIAQDIQKELGQIKAPAALEPFIQRGGDGAGGISLFLSNLIALIYSVAGVVFIFMLVWGAFEWMVSGGEKEKIASAQKRITFAVIGIILLSVTFAIIAVISAFTGFSFFI